MKKLLLLLKRIPVPNIHKRASTPCPNCKKLMPDIKGYTCPFCRWPKEGKKC